MQRRPSLPGPKPDVGAVVHQEADKIQALAAISAAVLGGGGGARPQQRRAAVRAVAVDVHAAAAGVPEQPRHLGAVPRVGGAAEGRL